MQMVNEDENLSVSVPPAITSTENVTTQEDEQNVEISCVATGDPQPTITWRRHGTEVIFPSQNAPDEDNNVSESCLFPYRVVACVTLGAVFSCRKLISNYCCIA